MCVNMVQVLIPQVVLQQASSTKLQLLWYKALKGRFHELTSEVFPSPHVIVVNHSKRNSKCLEALNFLLTESESKTFKIQSLFKVS